MSIATLSQGQQILNLVTQKKVSSEHLQRLLEGGFLADLLDANGNLERESFRMFLGLGQLMPSLTELKGIILPGKDCSLTSRIKDGGYDWKNDDITEKRFPLTLAAGPRPLVLAHFNKVMTSPQVEEWATENGYEVALIDDLLAVGSHSEYKELQRQFPIIALGSSTVFDGERYVPGLGRNDSKRDLDLGWYGNEWHGYCRFLLVRKS